MNRLDKVTNIDILSVMTVTTTRTVSLKLLFI